MSVIRLISVLWVVCLLGACSSHIGMWSPGDGVAPDYDGDGVPDDRDRCNVILPDRVAVDDFGCSWDDDRDGIHNDIDRCPETYPPLLVNQWGCVVDSDNDGVMDAKDQCPGTPAGVAVEVTGCPLDSDRDSVKDMLDECPGTPQGTPVDNKGCARLTLPTLSSVHFEFDRDVLKPSGYPILRQVSDYMAAYPQQKVLITGHTDSKGSEVYNLDLSWRRARSAYQYLLRIGVDAQRLILSGQGESAPLDSNLSVEGQARNRRVEFRALD